MYQFFVDKSQIMPEQGSAYIVGADVNHICHVLRMRAGEQFYINDATASGKYLCEFEHATQDRVFCRILDKITQTSELPCEIVLYQGLPKADKMELIVQKAVELGVSRIVPVATKNSVVKLDAKKAQAKVSRWQGIAEAAAKQSKRDAIPTVAELMSFKEALSEARSSDVSIMPYENAEGMDFTRRLLADIRPQQRVSIFIGPEGGFDEKEVEAALAEGTKPITLGRRILRTETAGIAVLSMLVYVLEA